jgi:hypothetical protein
VVVVVGNGYMVLQPISLPRTHSIDGFRSFQNLQTLLQLYDDLYLQYLCRTDISWRVLKMLFPFITFQQRSGSSSTDWKLKFYWTGSVIET